MRKYKIKLLFLSILFFCSCERIVDEDIEITIDYNKCIQNTNSENLWDRNLSTNISGINNNLSIKGKGAYETDSSIIIDKQGSYLLTGTINKQIIVDVPKDDYVNLIIENLKLKSSYNSPIFIKKSKATCIIVSDNSNNSIVDPKSYINSEISACIYSKSDLLINGNGKLSITANYKDGIVSKDGLLINSVNLTISSKDEGIIGKDYLKIYGGNYTINSDGDAIRSENTKDSLGYITIHDGIFKINSKSDGIQAESDIRIENGEFTISTKEATEGKTIKAKKNIQILDGKMVIESSDNAIDATHTILLNKPQINIKSQSDAIQSKESIKIINAQVSILKCNKGIETTKLEIDGGDIEMNALKDGIHLELDPEFINNNNETPKLIINGGNLAISSQEDCIDVKGDGTINGGKIILHNKVIDKMSLLDFDGTLSISNGELIGIGKQKKEHQLTVSNNLKYFEYKYDNAQYHQKLMSFQDENNSELWTIASNYDYRSIIIISNKLEQNKTYKLYQGGISTAENYFGLYKTGSYSSGNLQLSFKLETNKTLIKE
jgi:hypothetical protein